MLLKKLEELFVGKRVRITHVNMVVDDQVGICTAIHEVSRTENTFEILLDGNRLYGFIPELLEATSVEGRPTAHARNRRKIELFPFPRERKIIRDVMAECAKTKGGGEAVTSALLLLMAQLEKSHGDALTVKDACEALSMLAGEAALMRQDIKRKA